ncbi:unnamed protein product [Meganyctiphanes norvegica]|uniref:Cuticle protein n=1 Tax=Meganyctiphanes norvegica TaxID=48144 RepID=A0AAV2R002_MEGNR
MAFKAKVALITFIFGVAAAHPNEAPAGYAYPAPPPSYEAPAPSYHAPAEHKGMPYDYAYAVKDDYKGVDYSAKENSDGNNVVGEYRVLLPDGRTQIVTYTADHYKGFIADVSYEGEAQYPEPAPYKPVPSYKAPTPSYEAPAPSYKAPTPSYEAPAPSYEAPVPSYEAPSPDYGAAPAPAYASPPAYNSPSPAYGVPNA